MNNDPVATRRRLRTELKRLRLGANLTQKQVATTLDWSPSKVIRIESGTTSISTTDLQALLRLCGCVEIAEVQRLIQLARYSRRIPYSDYKEVISPEAIRFFGYETSAATIRQVECRVIPGLLQTDEYATAVLGSQVGDEESVRRIVEARKERQEVLRREDSPPEFTCIIDEGVLRRPVGSPSAMRRQLEFLASMAQMSNVTIKVFPFNAGTGAILYGSFIVLDFAIPEDLPLLYIEASHSPAHFIEDPPTVASHIEAFLMLEPNAIEIDETSTFISRATEDLEATPGPD